MRLEWGAGIGGQHRGTQWVPAVLSPSLQTAVPAASPRPPGRELLVGGPPLAAGCPWLALARASGMLLGDALSGPPTPPVSLDVLALPAMWKGDP